MSPRPRLSVDTVTCLLLAFELYAFIKVILGITKLLSTLYSVHASGTWSVCCRPIPDVANC